MKTKLYLDKRAKEQLLSNSDNAEREYPVKIAINHKGSSAYISTGISLPESQWSAKQGKVIGSAGAARIDIALSEKKLAVDKAIEGLRLAGELHGASASQIKRLVEKKLELDSYGIDGGEVPVLVCFDKFIQTKTRRGTINVYKATVLKLQAFDAFTSSTTFRSITPSWLAGFDSFLAKTSPSANARGIYLRNIRTVFNYALGEGYTTAQYPFKRYKIKTSPTQDRSLTAEELRSLRDAPCNPALEKYRDLFFLSFFLCGMNLEDILQAREIKGGRIEVRRIKTGQPLSIKVEPEAMDIINKYRSASKDGLLAIGRGCDYINFRHRINDNLKHVGKVYNPSTKEWEGEALFPKLSFYWARYSWATIAAELDIPERTIGYALGHSTSKSVTSIYTRVDMKRKIDTANRAVIDYCFPKSEPKD